MDNLLQTRCLVTWYVEAKVTICSDVKGNYI